MVRRSAESLRSRYRATTARPTTTNTALITGERESSTATAPSTSEPMPTERLTDLVRSSVPNVMTARRASRPSWLRLPMMPWIGPSRSKSPWMSRNGMGLSIRTPAKISRAIETMRSARKTSPKARTIWIVSRTSEMPIPRMVKATR